MFGCAFKNLSLVILPAWFLLVCLITAQKRELTCLMLKAIALIDWLLTEFLACQFIHYVHVCINFPALKSVTLGFHLSLQPQWRSKCYFRNLSLWLWMLKFSWLKNVRLTKIEYQHKMSALSSFSKKKKSLHFRNLTGQISLSLQNPQIVLCVCFRYFLNQINAVFTDPDIVVIQLAFEHF